MSATASTTWTWTSVIPRSVRLQADADGRLKPAATSDVYEASQRHARLPAGRRPPAGVRHRHRARRLRALRLRAARDAGVREHRDAARQVRRGGQQAHFQDPEARRARGQRRGGSRAALRPDGAARARRRAVPERAAEVLQALPDSARLARRPAGAGTVPRVLPVRHRRDRIDVAGRRGGAVVRRSATCSRRSASATSRSV